MTAREELTSILKKSGLGIIYSQANPNDPPCTLFDILMSWHNRHRVRVTREQVASIIRKQNLISSGYFSTYAVEELIDDLLALLNGEPKAWCKHIKPSYWSSEMGKTWQWANDGGQVTADFHFCHICGKPRPGGGE